MRQLLKKTTSLCIATASVALAACATAPTAPISPTAPALDAASYMKPAVVAGQRIANVFARTVGFSGGGIDDKAFFVGGSVQYQVADASPDHITLSYHGHYDGHPASDGSLIIRDDGLTNCDEHGEKCVTNTDASGVFVDPFLWGTPTGPMVVGAHWNVRLAQPWELGPIGDQRVTVVRIDPTEGIAVLKREGSGSGDFTNDHPQITVKRDGREYRVDVAPGMTHWTGWCTVQHGVIVTDEIVSTRTLHATSKDFGAADLTERQYVVFAQAPPELL